MRALTVGWFAALLVVAAIAQNPTLVVVRQEGSPQHGAASLAIQQALIDTASPLEIHWLDVGNNSLANSQAVTNYLNAKANSTSAAYLLDGLFGDETITAQLDSYQIPILRTTPTRLPATATASLDPRSFLEAMAHLFQHFGWTECILVRSSSLLAEAAEVLATARESGLNITETYVVDERITSQFRDVAYAIDRSPRDVVIFMGGPVELQLLVLNFLDVEVEIIWLDPTSATLVSYPLVQGLQSLTAVVGQSIIHGFFTIAVSVNRSNVAAFVARIEAQNGPSAFPNGAMAEFRTLGPAYDLALLWATAAHYVIASGEDPCNTSLTRAVFYELPASPPVDSIMGWPTKYSTAGYKIQADILNYQINVESNTTQWLAVGSWIGQAAFGPQNQLFVNQSALVFADGTNHIRPSSSIATISLGLISSLNSFQYWTILARLAIEKINADSSILPGYRLALSVEDDAASQAGVIQAAIRLIGRGVVGILGPTYTSYAQALQYYVGGLKIPTVAQAVTSDSLSDKSLFPTFFRVTDKDRALAGSMTSFVKRYNWTKICMATTTEYSALADTFTNDMGQGRASITRATIRNVKALVFTEVWDTFLSTNCSVYIAALPSAYSPNFLFQADSRGLIGPGKTWIMPPPTNTIVRTLMNRTSHQGMFFAFPIENPVPHLYDQLVAEMRNRTNLSPFVYSGYLYDAVWLMAYALDRMVRLGQDITPANLWKSLYQVTPFLGVTGMVSVDANGDRVGGTYGFYNFQLNTNNTNDLVLIGKYTNNQFDLMGIPVFSDGTTNPPLEPTLPVVFFPYDSGAITLLILAGVVLLSLLATIVFVLRLGTNKLVRRSSPFFLIVIAVGLILAVASIFFWIGEPAPVFCHLRVWLGFVGASLAYGALLAKNARLYYLYSEPSMRVISIPNQQLFTYLLLCLSPMLIGLVLWSSLEPFEVSLQLSASETEQYMVCTNPNDKIFAALCFGYLGALYVAGSFLSYRTRTLPDVFRESWYIALATYNLLVITTLCTVLGYVLWYDLWALTIIVCGGLIIGSLVTALLIFAPKLHAIMTRNTEIEEWTSSKRSGHGDKVRWNRGSSTKKARPTQGTMSSFYVTEKSLTVISDPPPPHESGEDEAAESETASTPKQPGYQNQSHSSEEIGEE